ncbi:MAG: hypothetical protein FWE74_02965 [Oscillospiraceae bacterium]|nr:hypothetical protein [Oscillospiraceae bacterium]
MKLIIESTSEEVIEILQALQGLPKVKNAWDNLRFAALIADKSIERNLIESGRSEVLAS